jgi:hypothetical protein
MAWAREMCPTDYSACAEAVSVSCAKQGKSNGALLCRKMKLSDENDASADVAVLGTVAQWGPRTV